MAFRKDDDDSKVIIKRDRTPLNQGDIRALKWDDEDSRYVKTLKGIAGASTTISKTANAIQDASDIATSIQNIMNFYDKWKSQRSYKQEEARGVKRLKESAKLIKVFDRSRLRVRENDGFESRKAVVTMFNSGFPIQDYPEYFEVDKLKVLSHIVAIMLKNNLPMEGYVPRRLTLDKLNKFNKSLVYKYGLPDE